MTTRVLDRSVVDAISLYGAGLGLRQPVLDGYPMAPTRTCTWTPDLSATETTVLDRLVNLSESAVPGLTPAEWQALEPFLTTGRAFLALSQAEFIALAQNARDRMLFDNVSAQWRVIFRLLRD